MSTEQLSPRDEAIKRTLVAMAELPPRRVPWWRGLLAIVGGFAIGGAVTGFLTAGAFAGWTPASSADDQRAGAMSIYALYQAESSTPLGEPHYLTGTGRMSIDLGAKPTGAVGVAYGFWCLGAGHHSVTVDGAPHDAQQCPASEDQPRSGTATIQGGGAHTLEVTGTGRYAVWVSWIHQPTTAKPSAAQQAAVTDGVITRDEYVQGFARLQGCMAQAGYPFGGVPDSEVIFGYSLNSEELPTFDYVCYPREFQDIDSMWQVQADTRLTACLKAAGITPNRDRDIALQQLAPAGLTPQGCGLLN